MVLCSKYLLTPFNSVEECAVRRIVIAQAILRRRRVVAEGIPEAELAQERADGINVLAAAGIPCPPWCLHAPIPRIRRQQSKARPPRQQRNARFLQFDL